MSPAPTSAPPPPRVTAELPRLRDLLARADYTEKGLPAALGLPDVSSILGCDPQVLAARAKGTPSPALIRLFVLGIATEADVARRAVEPLALDTLCAAGLVSIDGDRAIPHVQLLPYGGLVLAVDLTPVPATAMRADHVMAVGGTSLSLADLTVRRRCGSMLDLGTGSGIQALLAAAHSDRVAATDRNWRATRFAAFNARLNGLANVRCLVGDFLEPLQDRCFDLITGNLPFVVSPRSQYLFRDSGLPGDQLCANVVRAVPRHLRDGGYGQILVHWVHAKGQRWQDRLAGWCAHSGCDAWVLRLQTQDPAEYASRWRLPAEGDPERFAPVFDDWMRYFENQAIEAVSFGLVTLRRTTRPVPWFRTEDSRVTVVGPAGEHVLRAFRAQDFLAGATDDRTVLGARLRVAPDVRLEQRREPVAGTWHLAECRLRLTTGLSSLVKVEAPLAELVGRCTGERPLRDLLGDAANALGQDRERVAAAALPGIRTLLARGFLLPPSGEA